MVHQHKLIKDLLDAYLPNNAKIAHSPLPSKLKDLYMKTKCLDDPTIFRQLVGKFIFFTLYTSRQLDAFWDSDWAACPTNRHYVSVFFITMGGSRISWKSKKQATISLSSTEANYRSMCRVCFELAWLSRLISKFEVSNITPIPIKYDNMVVIYIAKHETYRNWLPFCARKVAKWINIIIAYSTKDEPADIFTKALSGVEHQHEISMLGLISCTPSWRGGGGYWCIKVNDSQLSLL